MRAWPARAADLPEAGSPMFALRSRLPRLRTAGGVFAVRSNRADVGLVAALGLSCAWVLLAFLILVLLSPVASIEGAAIRALIVLFPLGLLWTLYGGARGGAKTVTALFMLVLAVTELSLRSRSMTDTSLDAQTLVKLAVWGVGLLVAVLNWKVLRDAFREPAFVLLVVLTLWFMFTATYSPTRLFTFGSGVAFLSVVAFGAVARRLVPDHMLIKGGVAILTFLFCISLLLYVVAPQHAMAAMEGGTILRLAAPFGTPNGLGRAAVLSLILLAIAWRTRVMRWNSPLLLAALATAAACLILSQSRTAAIALLAALFVMFLEKNPIRLLIVLILGMAAALTVTVLDVDLLDFASTFSRTGRVSEITTLTGRTSIWQFTWGEIQKAPWLGYGHGASKTMFPELFRNYWGWTTTSAHNAWLHVWFASGIVGVLLMCSVFVAQFFYWLRTKDSASLMLLVFMLVISLAEAGHVVATPNGLIVMWALFLTGRRATEPVVATFAVRAPERSRSRSMHDHQRPAPGH